jgi:hypothetical protein
VPVPEAVVTPRLFPAKLFMLPYFPHIGTRVKIDPPLLAARRRAVASDYEGNWACFGLAYQPGRGVKNLQPASRLQDRHPERVYTSRFLGCILGGYGGPGRGQLCMSFEDRRAMSGVWYRGDGQQINNGDTGVVALLETESKSNILRRL